jgi:hypothetical protein
MGSLPGLAGCGLRLAGIAMGTAGFRFWPPSTEDRVPWVPVRRSSSGSPTHGSPGSSPPDLSVSLSNLSLSHLSRLSDLSHLCLTLSRCLFRATRRTEKKRRKKKGKRRKRREKKKWSGCELLKRESGLIL